MIRKVMEMSQKEEEERQKKSAKNEPEAVSPQDHKPKVEEKKEEIQPVI